MFLYNLNDRLRRWMLLFKLFYAIQKNFQNGELFSVIRQWQFFCFSYKYRRASAVGDETSIGVRNRTGSAVTVRR
jgi:hypothetical protein